VKPLRLGVVGATGVLGRNLIPRLLERGHEVRAIVRNPASVGWLRFLGVDAVQGDILQSTTLAPALLGCDAALHLATAVPRPGKPADFTMNDRIRGEVRTSFRVTSQSSRDGGLSTISPQ
jgi:uncharacterized protein YbjT (DUF2867 family)